MTAQSLPEKNKALIRRLLEEMDKGNLSVIDDYYDPNYVDHNPTPVRRLAVGIEGIKLAFRIFYTAFPDTKHVVEDMIAEGDRVAARISVRGTHTGELMGAAPTGRQVSQTAIAIYRIKDGRIVEKWNPHDNGILEQLGIQLPLEHSEH